MADCPNRRHGPAAPVVAVVLALTGVWSIGRGLRSEYQLRPKVSKGVISRGWYASLTGLAMLFGAWLIAPIADTDPAVPVVAVALALTGIWSIERGLRSEYQHRPKH